MAAPYANLANTRVATTPASRATPRRVFANRSGYVAHVPWATMVFMIGAMFPAWVCNPHPMAWLADADCGVGLSAATPVVDTSASAKYCVCRRHPRTKANAQPRAAVALVTVEDQDANFRKKSQPFAVAIAKGLLYNTRQLEKSGCTSKEISNA